MGCLLLRLLLLLLLLGGGPRQPLGQDGPRQHWRCGREAMILHSCLRDHLWKQPRWRRCCWHCCLRRCCRRQHVARHALSSQCCQIVCCCGLHYRRRHSCALGCRRGCRSGRCCRGGSCRCGRRQHVAWSCSWGHHTARAERRQVDGCGRQHLWRLFGSHVLRCRPSPSQRQLVSQCVGHVLQPLQLRRTRCRFGHKRQRVAVLRRQPVCSRLRHTQLLKLAGRQHIRCCPWAKLQLLGLRERHRVLP